MNLKSFQSLEFIRALRGFHKEGIIPMVVYFISIYLADKR
jgi:hypothetical protein